MYLSPGRLVAAVNRRLPPDIITPVMTVALPRGAMDLRLRLSSYPDGSRALELQDADGRPFYVPTMPCPLETLQELLPPEELDNIVLGIKPSALRNGMAGALVEAGLLVDLGLEMPVDRHFVQLMRFVPEVAGARAEAEERLAEAAVPARLLAARVPDAWKPGCRRIQSVFRRRGMIISEEDAFVAWVLSGNMVPRQPPRLALSADELFARMRDRFGQ